MRLKLVFLGAVLIAVPALPKCNAQSVVPSYLTASVDASPSSSVPDNTNGLFSSSSSDSISEAEAAVPPPAPTHVGNSANNEDFHPFSSVKIGLKVSTLGAGVELSTPLARRLSLRSQFNLTSFDYLFNIDGVNYDSKFKLRSGSLSFDIYPTHRSFRISPGVLYFNNYLNAVSSVPAGNYFELGADGFINSVDDPLSGNAAVLFSHKYAPMLTFGFNLIGRRNGRFTMPVEVGFAYTGPAKIDVTLNGTACNSDGCFTFADNQEAQQSMQEEIAKLNRNLSNYPVYPIVSLGMAYRFGHR